jgi:ribosomal-protein-alanine N-acetyltransferase
MAIISPKTFTLRNQQPVLLRSATADDVDAMIVFRRLLSIETTNTYHYPDMIIDKSKEVEFLNSVASHPKNFFITAFYENRVIGNLSISMVRDNHPWLTHLGYFGMGILKEFWSTGLAQILLQEMDIYAKKLGYRKIEATVKVGNEAGLQAYLEAGFVIEGRRQDVTCIDGKYFDEYHIAKHFARELWKPPILTTDRLVLRPITITDADSLYEYCKLPEVTTYTLWEPHTSLQDTKKWIRTYVKDRYAAQEYEPYGICLAESPERVIGTIGCVARNAAKTIFEMGFALHPKYWNKGYTTEAGKALIDFLFANTKAHKIYATHKSPNVNSGKAQIKMGMTYEGELKEHLFSKNKHWDIKLYSIFKRNTFKV